MTIARALATTSIDQHDAQLLLAHILQVPRTSIIAHPEQRLTISASLRFFWYTLKRKRHTPLAYITGMKEFYDLSFVVNKHTLVPRPETEQLVELAVSRITYHIPRDKNILLIDVGTGSGCIPIAVAKIIKTNSISFFASDISKQALRIAEKNATTHAVDIKFKHGNLLEPWINSLARDTCLVVRVVITANLPYLTEEQFAEEPSIQKEPKSALVAEENGLALYRELLEQMGELTACGVPLTAFFEIDPLQEQSIQALIREYYQKAEVVVHRDLCGMVRIVEVTI